MKNRKRWKKTAIAFAAGAALIVTIALSLSALFNANPTLKFDGMTFKLMQDGSIQATIDVKVQDVDMATGAYFLIQYNSTYLTPSDKLTNAPIAPTNGLVGNDRFFAVSPRLYATGKDGTPRQPFLTTADSGDAIYKGTGFCALDNGANKNQIYIRCMVDHKGIDKIPTDSLLKQIAVGEGVGEYRYCFKATSAAPVTVGTLYFRIAPEQIRTLIAAGTGATLLQTVRLANAGTEIPTWQLPYIDADGYPLAYTNATTPKARVAYEYNYPKTLISADAAAATVTVNAWQTYHDGTPGDLAAVLRTHSPMVTAGYSDGAMENFLQPWGAKNTTERQYDYKIMNYTPPTPEVPSTGPSDPGTPARPGVEGAQVLPEEYKPTGGTYLAKQYFYYEEKGTLLRFPLPIAVEVTVTPIRLTGATADKLNMTYTRTAALSTYSTFDSLELPTEARLVTDVLPGGASLFMPLPQWSPVPPKNADGTDRMETLMNGSGGHWPIATTPESDLTGHGTYTFRSPQNPPTDPAAFTGAAVAARYPWLTVEQTSRFDFTATRTIVADSAVIGGQNRYNIIATHSTTVPGAMELNIWGKTELGAAESLPSGMTFHLRLPNDKEILKEWFTSGGSYEAVYTATGNAHYTITVNPGTPPDLSAAERELTRRSINLGGWFSLSVERNQSGIVPTNFIPVYLAPRENRYAETKSYDFTGANKDLFSYLDPLATTVTMPRGSYRVGAQEVPYGVATTYDGATGAEPGRLHTFAVASWDKTVAGSDITYGPNAFVPAAYSGYGAVANPQNHLVTIKTQRPPDPVGSGRLELGYGAGVAPDTGGRILATYDAKQMGYTTRQEYRFTLKNIGSAPVFGIRIASNGTEFTVLGDGAATYLAPGASTDFYLTYAYGLPAKNPHKNTITVTYDDKKTLDFDARLRVTPGPVRRVTVVTLPELTPPATMGAAGLIEGEMAGPPKTMDYNLHDPNYVAGDPVWISARPTEEYEVKAVYYWENNNKTGLKKSLTKYDPAAVGNASLNPGTAVYSGEMPNYNVTIYVELEEPISSKLRLKSLTDYAAATPPQLKPDTSAPAAQTLWQKQFETADAAKTDLQKLRLGRADPAKAGYDPGINQYLVVIPAAAAYSQLEVKLWQLSIPFVGNADISPRVEMLTIAPDGTGTPFYDTDNPPVTTTTAPPSTLCTSTAFPSPEEGKSLFVQIRLSYGGVFRSYYLEIVRDTALEVGEQGYGNAPFGMIMSAENIPLADKQAAKDAFVAGGYRFAAKYTPTKASAMTGTYWREAWNGAATAAEGNCDLDDYAYFALLGQQAKLPAIANVKDSSGRPVAPKDLTRTAEVQLKDGTKIVLALGKADSTALVDWDKNPATPADDRYAIAPGQYELRYSYLDYDGVTQRSFTRPFLVLGMVGDMNADGKVVSAPAAAESDLDLLQNRVRVPLVYAENPLVRLRTCDVNNDRNINNIDANKLHHAGALPPFYQCFQ